MSLSFLGLTALSLGDKEARIRVLTALLGARLPGSPSLSGPAELHSTASLLSSPPEGSCGMLRLQPRGSNVCRSYGDWKILEPGYPGTCRAKAHSLPRGAWAQPCALLEFLGRAPAPGARNSAVCPRLGFHPEPRPLSVETSTLPKSNARYFAL